MAGRRPKPTRIKEIAGNPGNRPLNAREPKPPLGIPECPEHLNDEAKLEWERLTVYLANMGMLSQVYRAPLAAYCQAWGRWVEAERELKKYGKVIKTTNGNAVQNPYLSIANTAMDQMRKLAIEFGLTPAAQSRIEADAPPLRPPADDSSEKYFSKHDAPNVVTGPGNKLRQ